MKLGWSRAQKQWQISWTVKGSTNCVPGEPTRSLAFFLWWRSLKNGNASSACPWKEVRVDRDVREGAPGPRTPELQFSPPKGPLLTPPTLLPSPVAISIFCTPLRHRTENSSYWKPSRMSESRTPEFQSRLKSHILLTWECPP